MHRVVSIYQIYSSFTRLLLPACFLFEFNKNTALIRPSPPHLIYNAAPSESMRQDWATRSAPNVPVASIKPKLARKYATNVPSADSPTPPGLGLSATSALWEARRNTPQGFARVFVSAFPAAGIMESAAVTSTFRIKAGRRNASCAKTRERSAGSRATRNRVKSSSARAIVLVYTQLNRTVTNHRTSSRLLSFHIARFYSRSLSCFPSSSRAVGWPLLRRCGDEISESWLFG